MGPIIWPRVLESINNKAGVKVIPKITVVLPYLLPIVGNKEVAGVAIIHKLTRIKNEYNCSFEIFL